MTEDGFFLFAALANEEVIVLTEKELKKLNRLQLLELLIIQTEENEKLKKQLEELKIKRAEEAMKISRLGSVAEASVQISGVLTAAQACADLYLETAKIRAEAIVAEAEKKADKISRGAKK